MNRDDVDHEGLFALVHASRRHERAHHEAV